MTSCNGFGKVSATKAVLVMQDQMEKFLNFSWSQKRKLWGVIGGFVGLNETKTQQVELAKTRARAGCASVGGLSRYNIYQHSAQQTKKFTPETK